MKSILAIARRAHPSNRRHAAKFVLAARWLRQRNAWVIDQGSRPPKWANTQESRA